jgi:hypothetical protein
MKEMSKKVFTEESEKCGSKKDWQCEKTTFACRDFLCPLVQSASTEDEFKKMIKKLS